MSTDYTDIPEILKGKKFYSKAVKLITNRRLGRYFQDSCTLEHDAKYTEGELALQALYYACPPQYTPYVLSGDGSRVAYPAGLFPPVPFYQGKESHLTRLIEAGALIASEIDRLVDMTEDEYTN